MWYMFWFKVNFTQFFTEVYLFQREKIFLCEYVPTLLRGDSLHCWQVKKLWIVQSSNKIKILIYLESRLLTQVETKVRAVLQLLQFPHVAQIQAPHNLQSQIKPGIFLFLYSMLNNDNLNSSTRYIFDRIFF